MVSKVKGIHGFSSKALKEALNKGPVAVAVNSNSKVFQSYSGGIIDDPKCSSLVNHAVLAVGYGKDEETGKEYFIIKNSWGPRWGENGYARIAANRKKWSGGMCGILTFPYIAYVKEVDATSDILKALENNEMMVNK